MFLAHTAAASATVRQWSGSIPKHGKKRVVAFLHPFYQQRYDVTLCGTYSTAIDSDGRKLYITWNASRGSRAWDCCCLTVVHVPPED